MNRRPLPSPAGPIVVRCVPTTRAVRAGLLATLGAAAIVSAGCTSMGNATSNSSVSAPGHQVRRLLVVANVEDRFFTKAHYAGFQAAFSEALRECGTVVEHLHYDRLDLDWRKTLGEKIRTFNADSTLIFRNPGGGRIVTGSGGTNSDLNYESRLFDVRGKEVWRARTQFRFLSGNLFTIDKAGEGLGRTIAGQIRKDTLVAGCQGAAQAAK